MSDSPERPKWYGSARGAGKVARGPKVFTRAPKPAKQPKQPRPRAACTVFSEAPEPDQALAQLSERLRSESELDGRQLSGRFAPGWAGGPGAAVGEVRVKPSMETLIQREQTKIRRTVRQIIREDFPGAMERTVAIQIEIMEDTNQTAAARLAAARELQNRHDGKAVERRTVKRTSTDTSVNFNLAMFGPQGAAILEAVTDPESRHRLAAVIHQSQQLEHAAVIEVEANGQEDVTEVRPGRILPVQGSDESGV